MPHVHFIAIGGAAMHSLAIALSEDPAYRVTGSDDEIFEPSRSRLQAHGLLPAETGWHPERIDGSIDAVVVGMHATADNPELRRARELGLRIYSFPEYLYEHTRGKKRVVVGGSHGKTTTTAMILHVLHRAGIEADYMVGAQIEGLDNMVRLSADARVAVFEGDEYLTSPLDPRPKFHLYKPHVAVLTGIAWDHINVFPTFDCYVEQFRHSMIPSQQEFPFIARVVHYMRENVRHNLTLKELSAYFKYSPSHFSALFQKETGVSPMNYFTRLKIQKACEYIELTSMRLTEIATLLGFENAAYFSRTFTKVMGCPPSVYREKER